MRRNDDSGVAAVIGAVVILGILSTALVYVNAFHMPRQGAALEHDAGERAQVALAELASRLSAAPSGPFTHDVPLTFERPAPPLLSGVVLTPARVGGALSLDADSTRLTLSVVVPSPPEGIPAGDATRSSAGAGLMRVHLVGSSNAGQPMGALIVTTGGGYDAGRTISLEGGAIMAASRGTSVADLPPSLHVASDVVTWRVPLLGGPTSDLNAATGARITCVPGPEALLGGGGAVHEVRIRIGTAHLAAWQSALLDAVGSRGTVVTTRTGPDAGFVEATVADVRLELFVVHHQIAFDERAG